MKNLCFILLLSFSLQANIFANGGKIEILKSKLVEITATEFMADFIISSKFNFEEENVDMIFASDISMIQIFDTKGEVVTIIPIGSDELRIGLSIFEKGNYKLGFIIEGEADIQYADISIK